MQTLPIKRELNEDTRKQAILINGVVYSLHISYANEVIITDNDDYSKIYSIQAFDFFQAISE